MQDLLGLPPLDVARAVRDVAPEPFRAAQIFRWIYTRRAVDFAEMTSLPKPMREALSRRFAIGVPRIVARTPAPDGTEKFLFELADGARIEAVYIVESKKTPSWTDPDTPGASRITICLSSQAGCAVDCAFCVTGRMGAGRNLTAGEIVGQYLAIARAKGFGPHEANVVFMGMGEPLLNVSQVTRALDLLEDEVSPKRTTVSTAGVVPGIESLAGRPRRPNLAVSLSGADDATRTKLMPINRTYPLAELFAALKRWPLERGRKITFEYVLIEGVNDATAEATKLAALVRALPAKVNLIPLNESREWLPGLKRPSDAAVNAFAKAVAAGGISVTVRWSKGLQADAACGQLRGREEPRRPAR
ncbi:MAG TPA: 23S rRNA (adenine(2503)-C(2))-methyltransferase RlmN [Thermoanaerobaculia bacterium]|nr:23S rRNA (adenine(2503)-C(2))-methyltransferase RlmN [Thermoanaerobaculia bacterium]